MKLQCTADARAWADVVDVWTRKLLREFTDILQAGLEGDAEASAQLQAYYRRVFKDAAIVDADGTEIAGLDAILGANDESGLDNVDVAVVRWWADLPFLAYRERQKLGEAKRVS